MTTLVISGLRASVDGHEILRGIDLEVASGRVEVIMGPNGSGKSTLANVVMGHPAYQITAGDVLLDGESLLGLPTHERSARGLFHAMQYPTAVPGVRFDQMLVEAFAARGAARPGDLMQALRDEAGRVHLEEELLDRSINVDFSGGEKKRAETVQLALLHPSVAVLDEIDSGLDIDALRAVSRRVEELEPDAVHVLMEGRIVKSGGPELAGELEETGYEGIAAELGIELARREEEQRAGREAGKGVAMDVEGPMTQGAGLDF